MSAHIERDVVAAVLRKPEWLADVQRLGLEPEDFQDKRYGNAYSVAAARAAKGKPVSPQVLRLLLSRAPAGMELPNDLDLDEMSSMLVHSPHEAAEAIAEDARRRRLWCLFDSLRNRIELEGLSSADALGEISAATRSGRIIPLEQRDTSLASALREVVVLAEDVVYGDGRAPSVFTGFAELDQLCGGMLPGELDILAARTSMGKTALACDIAVNVAAAGQHVVVYQLEGGRSDFARRVLTRLVRVGSSALRSGALRDEDVQELQHAEGRLVTSDIASRIHVVDDPTMTMARISADVVARRQSGAPLDLVIIDYLQLVRSPAAESETVRLGRLSDDALALAGGAPVAVMALAQVNRDCTNRVDKRPTVAELRGSDAIGHAADRVIFVHRDDYYDADKGPGSPGFAQVIVAKNRHGSTGTAHLWFERGHFWEDRTDARLG